MTKELTFASILENKIYKDRDVLFALQPPTGFLHRTKQKNELVMELAPILMNSPVSCVFVYGNPGTGKSAMLLDLLEELKGEARKRNIDLVTAYVNCSENRTETSILLSILDQVNKDKKYPKMGWNRAKTIDEFNKVLNKEKMNVLMLLDEVDYALRESGDDILYRLSRINNQIKSKASTIIISNDVRVSDYIKPRTQSAFGRIKIIFSPYNANELFDIIKERVKLALNSEVVSDAVIKKIAEIESQRGGDARKALELVDACAKIAIAKKRNKITIDLVEEADKSIEENSVLNIIASLPKHQKIVYLAVLKNEKNDLEMEGGEVYKDYLELCVSYNVEPLTERRIRTFLVNLNETSLINAEVGWLKTTKKKARKITVNLDKALKTKAEKLLRNSI
ncbi:AAA family ATPase [Candidatus Woesearchaeota archaeon]|nr:AAA family ATPase [Candidatus Woesearchaeota archaeon]